MQGKTRPPSTSSKKEAWRKTTNKEALSKKTDRVADQHAAEPIIPILRIWHAFESEKLRNIDGKDLLPLPNIKDLKHNGEMVNLPYLDTLMNDSKIVYHYTDKIIPQIFIYSGKNLSPAQKKQYEGLHENAKSEGGELFVLDGDEYFKEEMGSVEYDHRMLSTQTRYNGKDMFGVFEFESKFDTNCAASFIDCQRSIYLNNVEKIERLINEKYYTYIQEKYGAPISMSGVFYCDFDRNPRLNVFFLKKRDLSVTMHQVMVIATEDMNEIKDLCDKLHEEQMHQFLLGELRQNPIFKVVSFAIPEWNAIYQPKGLLFTTWGIQIGSPYSERLSDLIREEERVLREDYGLRKRDVHTYSKEGDIYVSGKKINLKAPVECNGSVPALICTKKARNKVQEAREKVWGRHGLMSLPGDAKMEMSIDGSWKKNISQLIIADHNRDKDAPNQSLADVSSPEWLCENLQKNRKVQ